MLVLIIQVYSDHTAVFTDLDTKIVKKVFIFLSSVNSVFKGISPGPFCTKSITGVQKLVSAFIFYKTSWLLLRSNQRKQEISFKKKIFGCSSIVDLICTSIAVCYTCKPDNHSRESQSELPLTIPLNFVKSDLVCTSRVYFDNVTLVLHNMTLTSQKPCKYN